MSPCHYLYDDDANALNRQTNKKMEQIQIRRILNKLMRAGIVAVETFKGESVVSCCVSSMIVFFPSLYHQIYLYIYIVHVKSYIYLLFFLVMETLSSLFNIMFLNDCS